MAKTIVARNQQAEFAKLHPMPAYSRIVNLEVEVPAGVGGEGWNYTEALGQDLRILRVDLHLMSRSADALIGGFIYITQGFGKPANSGVVATEWTPVIKNKGIKPGLYWCGIGSQSYSWSMRLFLEGQPRRLGLLIENFSATEQWHAWASFEIAEG